MTIKQISENSAEVLLQYLGDQWSNWTNWCDANGYSEEIPQEIYEELVGEKE